MSNRLPVLAENIKRAHSGLLEAAKTAADRAIEAGQALIEAKELVKHGEWLPWLKDYCGLPERTAQLYMAIAKSGLKPATVADLGLQAAAKVSWSIYDPDYNPYAHCDEAGKRDWALFILFLVHVWRWKLDAASSHVEWLLQRQFKDPEEWLGSVGAMWRQQQGMREPSASYLSTWAAFQDEHTGRPFDDIENALVAIKDAAA
ncbi:hypothetical protein X727_23070 [Mesorhizobium sp. L103C119B0]|uniref:DUF3102 domain-containing protein n=1 Tax=Mesorhizobium sp. L103C119B0 TaxID=1287085 RepID=UPI0003CF9F92|nr:DUF3102 domain-containing protein [Mesorhizobium sp. L103C119B0]ESZ68165.1 hypothetical protein X727_23070 [Mesorhizobium sp. L103C119B0]